MKITLLIPSLNEIEGLKALAPRIKKEWVDEIFLVDGGSTDGTFEFAQSLGYRVLKQKRTGVGGAYLDALELIDSDAVITFSPDGNSIPERIPDLVEKLREGYDMVIVSRYLDGAKSEDDDWVTGFGNWMFTAMINILFGGKYTDTLVIYRGFKTELFKDMRELSHYESYDVMLSIFCAKEKRRVTEIPGDEPKRIGGERKMQPFRNGLQVLKLIWQELICPRKLKKQLTY